MKTIRNLPLQGKKVLLRVDFNVPLIGNGNGEKKVFDDHRIRAVLPTIEYLLKHKAKVILISHLGRPEGKQNLDFSLDPATLRLQELLKKIVTKCYGVSGAEVERTVGAMAPGEIIMLANLRFYPGEEKNDPHFAKGIAKLGDIYVNDAFAVSHRAHASVEAITHYLPSYSGFLMEKEIETLDHLMKASKSPFLCIMGGAKISDKIGVVTALKDKFDVLAVGGIIGNAFLAGKGLCKGSKRKLTAEDVKIAKKIMIDLTNGHKAFYYPIDVVISSRDDGKGEVITINNKEQFLPHCEVYDIGPMTVATFKSLIKKAKTIFWNGNMGLSEVPIFAKGTEEIALAMSKAKATTIVAGGDTTGFVNQLGLGDKMTYMSTGGGATLEYLAGKKLPGIEVLKD